VQFIVVKSAIESYQNSQRKGLFASLLTVIRNNSRWVST